MSDMFQCGDQAALVGYLYDDCGPGERDAIATHLKRCLSCSGEIEALTTTRRTLAAWTPPEMTLGFQMTSAQYAAPKAATVLTHTPWWKAPLPAWAQAVAALVVFAAGLSAGLARSGAPLQTAPQASTATVTPSAAPVSVSRDELAQLEQRMKAEMSQMRTGAASTPVSARVNDDAVIQQVKSLVEQSEERQRREFTLRMVELASNIETQRRVDLASVSQTIGKVQGVTGTEVRQQREAIDRINNYLINNVSQRTR